MVRVILPACALLAGCAQLFGLDSTTGTPDVPLPPRATVAIDRVGFSSTVEVAPTPLTGLMATYYIPDDVDTSGLRRIAATADGTTWTAEVPDGVAASVDVTLPDEDGAPRRFYSFPNRDLRIQYGVYKRAGHAAAPMNASLNVTLTLPSGYVGEPFYLYAIGPWRNHVITTGLPAAGIGATQIGPVDIAYTTATFGSTAGQSELLEITTADRLVALRYSGNDLTASAEVTPFMQTGTDTISATLVDNPHAPLDVQVEPAAVASRLAGATPAGGGAAMSWSVRAAPGYQYAANLGPQLNAASIDTTQATTTVTAGYGNPFTALGWRSLFTFASNRSRSYTAPAFGLPYTLYTGLNQHLEPAAGARVDVPAPLPVLVLVNDAPLTTDGLTVTIDPNKSVKLSLVADRTAATFYQYNIIELAPDAMPATAIVAKNVMVAAAPTTDITIPAGVFTTGKTYVIRAHCYRGGFPAIAMGDFSQRDLPLSVGYQDSGVFTVAAP